MKITYLITALVIAASASFSVADENHEILEIVMKEGMKGDESPLSKILDGKGSKEDADNLLKFVEMLEGTKAPVGDQKAFEAKVAKLIAAAKKVAGGDTGEKAIDALDKASNCKACHTDHKPKKKG